MEKKWNWLGEKRFLDTCEWAKKTSQKYFILCYRDLCASRSVEKVRAEACQDVDRVYFAVWKKLPKLFSAKENSLFKKIFPTASSRIRSFQSNSHTLEFDWLFFRIVKSFSAYLSFESSYEFCISCKI